MFRNILAVSNVIKFFHLGLPTLADYVVLTKYVQYKHTKLSKNPQRLWTITVAHTRGR